MSPAVFLTAVIVFGTADGEQPALGIFTDFYSEFWETEPSIGGWAAMGAGRSVQPAWTPGLVSAPGGTLAILQGNQDFPVCSGTCFGAVLSIGNTPCGSDGILLRTDAGGETSILLDRSTSGLRITRTENGSVLWDYPAPGRIDLAPGDRVLMLAAIEDWGFRVTVHAAGGTLRAWDVVCGLPDADAVRVGIRLEAGSGCGPVFGGSSSAAFPLLLSAAGLLEGPATAGEAVPGPVPGMEFIRLPAGTFLMGSPGGERGRDSDEGPCHSVTVASFEMMTTEVTQESWEAVMRRNPSQFKAPDHPVDNVTWDDCQSFIALLNSLDDGYDYRLPSEAEWEYAYRAGTGTAYHWGDSDAAGLAKTYCWYNLNSNDPNWTTPHAQQEGTQPVASKEPNSWGLYDMAGNVSEWVEDFYHDGYTGAPADGSAWVEGGGTFVLMRGGSWLGETNQCRAAARSQAMPSFKGEFIGFRLVRTSRV
jgi:formylglycine-generating enzyme required for sulfatase activity